MWKLFSTVALFIALTAAGQGTITTIAGAPWDFFAHWKSTQAVDAPLGATRQIAFDASGNLYITDTANYIVMKVTPAGVGKVVAGTGSFGYSGDGGPATSAMISRVNAIALDGTGNLFIADTDNSRIRKVASDGTITTVAGSGSASFSGDGGLATAAGLPAPVGIAVDASGNLFIADNGVHRIRKVTADGIIRTIAGGNPGFSGDGGPALKALLAAPQALVLDAAGNLYVADSGNNVVRKISASDATITSVAGTGASQGFSGDGGLATSAKMGLPNGLAIDVGGNLYISDYVNSRIRKVTPAGIISTIAGGGTAFGNGISALSASFVPYGVAVDVNNNVYVSSLAFIIRVGSNATLSTFAGNGIFRFYGDGGPAAKAVLNNPTNVAVDAKGNVYIADTYSVRVRRISPDGTIVTIAGGGSGFVEGAAATSVAVYPVGIDIDSAGNLIIADYAASAVRKVSTNGTITTVAQGAIGYPAGIAVDSAGNIFVADPITSVVRKISVGGSISIVAGTPFSYGYGSESAHLLYQPHGVAVDPAGNLYIADSGNGRIRKVTPAGVSSTVTGAGSFYGALGDGGAATDAYVPYPTGVALDASGNIFIADSESNSIRKITTDGIITTIAGGGTATADGSLAVQALLASPQAVAASGGNIFIVDTGLNRVLKVPDVAPSTFTVSFTNLNLTQVSGGTAVSQQLTLDSSYRGLPWAASISTTSLTKWLTVPAAGTSPGMLSISADPKFLCAGTYQGTVTIKVPGALPPVVAIAVTLTVQAPAAAGPPPVVGLPVNAASFADRGNFNPGSLISIFGTNLGPLTYSQGLPWPTTLGGTSVAFNGVPIPLNFVSPGQINAQSPWELPGPDGAALTVNVNGMLGCAALALRGGFSLGIFTVGSSGQGAILIANTALLAANGPGGRPATTGDYLSIFATGLGGVSNPPADGAAASSNSLVSIPPYVMIGGVDAPVTFAGLAPGFVGLYQVNVQVPASAPKGNAVPVFLNIVGGPGSNRVTIAIQ